MLLCLVLLLALVAIKVWWSSYEIAHMEAQMEEVRVILQLVSEAEINANAEIKQRLIDNEDAFNVLA